jgi:glyoxylase-like metal-dependent hydrolase (beta-lactamase superfamily II)
MNSPTRRSLLAAPAAAALASAPPALARRPAGLVTPPAIAQLRLGRVTVNFLSDGFIEAPTDWLVGEAPEAMRRRVAARIGGDGRAFRINFTAWLVDDGERLTLVDTGSAGEAAPTTGRLPAALRALGVAPADIDLVAVTHAHFDHVGGLAAADAPAFPNAEVLIHRADVAHFTDAARRAAAPEFLRNNFDATARVVAVTPRLQRVDGERALTPYVSTVDLAGHTPGHTGFRIADGGQSLLIVGDALFDPALHPERDDIGIVYEADPGAARAMRRRLFARAAEEGALIAATHMPFPGLGRIGREGGRYTWMPADFPLA